MRLLLARHGNTFRPGETVRWVGATEDLPLVETGREQAVSLARALRDRGALPDAVYCGGLARTLDYARLVAGNATPPTIDRRLDEIDYGEWSGRTDEEVAARFGRAALELWRTRSLWPADAGWGGSETEVRREIRDLVRDLAEAHGDRTVLLVSSNGRLRYFLDLVPGELERRFAAGTFHVGTGNLCKLVAGAKGFEVAYWNVDPAAAATL